MAAQVTAIQMAVNCTAINDYFNYFFIKNLQLQWTVILMPTVHCTVVFTIKYRDVLEIFNTKFEKTLYFLLIAD